MAITATKAVLMNEGLYPSILEGWEETPDDRGFGIGIKVIWALDGLTDNEGKQQTKWQYLSQKLTPRSNLWKFLKSFGVNVTLGQSYEIEELMNPLVGTPATLVIKHEDTPSGPQAKVKDVMVTNASAAPAQAGGNRLISSLKADPPKGTAAVETAIAETDACGICGKASDGEEMIFTDAGVYIHARHNN